jgi:flavin-binding protein dodecin
MSNHVYKKVEIVGSSKDSLESAIENAVNRAAKSLHNLRWFEVNEIRGHIENGKVDHWQVGVKIGFTLDEE